MENLREIRNHVDDFPLEQLPKSFKSILNENERVKNACTVILEISNQSAWVHADYERMFSSIVVLVTFQRSTSVEYFEQMFNVIQAMNRMLFDHHHSPPYMSKLLVTYGEFLSHQRRAPEHLRPRDLDWNLPFELLISAYEYSMIVSGDFSSCRSSIETLEYIKLLMTVLKEYIHFSPDVLMIEKLVGMMSWPSH
jgi:hypothetical protein